jgi:hypothetical protein
MRGRQRGLLQVEFATRIDAGLYTGTQWRTHRRSAAAGLGHHHLTQIITIPSITLDALSREGRAYAPRIGGGLPIRALQVAPSLTHRVCPQVRKPSACLAPA